MLTITSRGRHERHDRLLLGSAAAILFTERLHQLAFETKFLRVADTNGHRLVIGFRVGTIRLKQPIPPRKVETEVAVRFALWEKQEFAVPQHHTRSAAAEALHRARISLHLSVPIVKLPT